jgi:adenylate kinase
MTENSNNIISVTGVSGAGKDFLLIKTQERQQVEDRLPIINAGTELLSMLRSKGIITEQTTRDEIKLILKEENLQGYVREIVASLDPGKKYIFNGHIVTKSGDFLKFNPEIEKEISPQKYILVTADPLDIIKWRDFDISRKRQLQTRDQIELEQVLVLSIVTALSVAMKIDLTVLENNPNNTKNNTDFLMSL